MSIILEDIFEVKNVDPDGKKFEKGTPLIKTFSHNKSVD